MTTSIRPTRGPILSGTVACADNLQFMSALPGAYCDLIYADPPFFTGRQHQGSRKIRRVHGLDQQAGGHEPLDDRWAGGLKEYLEYLRPRIMEMHRLLKPTGTLYVHLDWHAVHYARVLLDQVFGYEQFLNEIVWSYRTGGGSTRWFARKHDTLLAYARSRGRNTFHQMRAGHFRTDGLSYDEAGRPYKSTRKGRLYFHPDGPALTDVWDIPFLSTVSRERTGYPTQKPQVLLERIVQACTSPGDLVADFFCGSGTALAAAKRLGRRYLGCDISPAAVALTRARLDIG